MAQQLEQDMEQELSRPYIEVSNKIFISHAIFISQNAFGIQQGFGSPKQNNEITTTSTNSATERSPI